ncbi:hypothetical protein NZ698_15080 [Chryseobacterium sp. PBS4-4]|uniref:PH domain-containing protein n=1 Tax=Chryseobacterium edaphi TaxID=2976532 RepID=A0ABT2W8I4_9FLAO|nr:hypothetical protein [Chryseobacterium edaphi]MCU7618520.1 hypothetical protein [Chryseobacterium edaphi]
MKDKVIYKSNSFSINVFIFFLGFIFFSLAIWLTFTSLKNHQDDNSRIVVYVIDFIFLIGSLGSLFYFLKTQIIKVTENYLILSYQFLPFSRKILINQIKGFKQKSKPVKYSKGLFDKAETVHTIFETFIILKNNEKIRTYSLTDFEFYEVRKLVEKIKRGIGHFDVEK